MFPFQQWTVETMSATNSSSRTEASQAVDDAAAERAAEMLESLVAQHGRQSLQRMLPFEVLGVHEYASADEVKGAFRRLSRLYHPDKRGSDDTAASIFEAVRHAAEALKDDKWRTAANEDAISRFFSPESRIRELNLTEHDAALESDGPLWLLIYFAPWCHQCIVRSSVSIYRSRPTLAALLAFLACSPRGRLPSADESRLL